LKKDGKLTSKPIDYELTEPATEPITHLTFARFIKLTGLIPGTRYLGLVAYGDGVNDLPVNPTIVRVDP